jgi:hypothetical protein
MTRTKNVTRTTFFVLALMYSDILLHYLSVYISRCTTPEPQDEHAVNIGLPRNVGALA